MADDPLFRMRIGFNKTGRAALLSHLEVARSLERTVRRARLPFAVSNGFSPHMRISFGSALPVGTGSTCECCDVLLTRYIEPDTALEALIAGCVPDLMVTQCCFIGRKDPAASAAFPYSTYRISIDGSPDAEFLPQQVTVVRKKKERTLDVGEFLIGPIMFDDGGLTLTLEQKPTGSLRPDVLMDAWSAAQKEGFRVISLTRIAQSPVRPSIGKGSGA